MNAPISELLAVKIENLTLKIQQVQAIHQQFVTEQAKLIEEARLEVNAPTDYLYNTDTRAFQAPAIPFATTPQRQAKRVKG